jgi:hypothetical protein
MERQRGREMNPPSADPPSATPAARANLPGSVAAAFNGTFFHALSLPDVIYVCCHVSSLNFASAREFLPPTQYGMRSHPLCITGIFYSVPQNFDLKSSIFIFGIHHFSSFHLASFSLSSHHHSLILICVIRSRGFNPGHVHWVQHQEAGQRALQDCRVHQ